MQQQQESQSVVSADVVVSSPLSFSVNGIDVDASGRVLVLGGKRGLHLFDFEDIKQPRAHISLQSFFEVSCVSCNPNLSKASLCVGAVCLGTPETLLLRMCIRICAHFRW